MHVGKARRDGIAALGGRSWCRTGPTGNRTCLPPALKKKQNKTKNRPISCRSRGRRRIKTRGHNVRAPDFYIPLSSQRDHGAPASILPFDRKSAARGSRDRVDTFARAYARWVAVDQNG